MVQVIQTGNPQGKLAETLGMSLGQGLGQGLNTFYANKAIDEVLNDPNLKDAPLSQKWQQLGSTLAKYGETGQQLLMNRLQAEQYGEQEKQTKLAKKEALDKETRLFTHQKELQKMKNEGKTIPAAEKATPKEQLDAIAKTRSDPEYENMNETERYNALINNNVSPSNAIKEAELYSKQATRENEKEKLATKEDIAFHNQSKDFEEKIRKEAKTAKEKLDTIAPIIKDIKEGKIKPTSAANVFRHLGKTGKAISDAILSGSEARLLAAVPEFLEGRKELFGVRLSDADLALLQDKLPDIGKSKEANLQILELMEKYSKRSIIREEAANKVLKEKGAKSRQGNLRPLNYENMVEEEYDKLVNEEENGVQMKLPDGRIVPIKRNNVKDAEAKGASRI